MSVGERIRYLRKSVLHVTQQDFSTQINMSRSNLGNIETGAVSVTERVINDISDTYGINKNWLLNGGSDEDIFIKKTQDEIFYEMIQDMIDDVQNPLYSLMKDVLIIYNRLDSEHKSTLNECIDMLIKQIASHEEQP